MWGLGAGAGDRVGKVGVLKQTALNLSWLCPPPSPPPETPLLAHP